MVTAGTRRTTATAIIDDAAVDMTAVDMTAVDMTAIDMAAIDDAAIARIGKALGHPARVRIVHLLLERHSCIGGDIVLEVGLAQSTVSEHLRILRAAGVIVGEIERPRVCYALVPAAVRPLTALLAAIAAHDASLDPDCCS